MNRSRQASLATLLMALSSTFEAKGWRLVESPRNLLEMSQTPQANVEHRLLVHEPFLPDDLPQPGEFGLACQVNIYFGELENVISRAFGRDLARAGRLSMVLRLSQLCPTEHLFAGNVHLVHLGNGAPPDSTGLFVKDYETYLEPDRIRLADISVFGEEQYRPAKVDEWTWNIRRAAYYHLRESRGSRDQVFDMLRKEAEAALSDPSQSQSGNHSGPRSLSNLGQDARKRGAEELLRLLAVLA